MISNYCLTFAALLTNISIKMKKYFAWMMTAILFCGLTTVLTSCGSDDDNGKDSGATLTKVRVVYTVTTDQSVIDAFNVNVYNTFEDGNTNPEAMSNTTWTKTVEIPASKLPVNVQLYTVIKPSVDGATSSNLSYSLKREIELVCIYSDGTIGAAKKTADNQTTKNVEDGTSLADFAKDTNNDQTHWSFTVSKDGTIN
jgi:hypothetical protein